MKKVAKYKEVRCRRCLRILKNPKARLLGIGSTCQKKENSSKYIVNLFSTLKN